ncbi:MAG: sigma-70 family RNA polymerase sigma factor [Synergistaceae bacterium]|jgi:RNA polymerase sigma factor (sigma-70 family)|nr:sigma-70 family RNA polymerase sigma factor [Synergistaceae bacterium]
MKTRTEVHPNDPAGPAGKAGKANKEGEEDKKQLLNERRNSSVAALLREFAPLVRRVARQYSGRGAERDDLMQEGCLALTAIARRCTRKQIAHRLANRLPDIVRDAALKMRWRSGARSFDSDWEAGDWALDVPDERAQRDFEELEVADLLERLLDEPDRAVARAAIDGMTQREIASAMGTTQQAIAKRLKKIRLALEGAR